MRPDDMIAMASEKDRPLVIAFVRLYWPFDDDEGDEEENSSEIASQQPGTAAGIVRQAPLEDLQSFIGENVVWHLHERVRSIEFGVKGFLSLQDVCRLSASFPFDRMKNINLSGSGLFDKDMNGVLTVANRCLNLFVGRRLVQQSAPWLWGISLGSAGLHYEFDDGNKNDEVSGHMHQPDSLCGLADLVSVA